METEHPKKATTTTKSVWRRILNVCLFLVLAGVVFVGLFLSTVAVFAFVGPKIEKAQLEKQQKAAYKAALEKMRQQELTSTLQPLPSSTTQAQVKGVATEGMYWTPKAGHPV